MTLKIARAASALALQHAVAAAVVCFCRQQRKDFTQRKETCYLQIQQVAQKSNIGCGGHLFFVYTYMSRMEYVAVAFSVKTDLLHFQWKSLLHFPKQLT